MECFILIGAVTILTLFVLYKWNRKTTLNYKKSVFISGCDSGIGYKLASHLDSLGCVVYAGCLFPDEGGAKLLRAENSNCLKVVPLDVTSDQSISDAVEYVKKDLNGGDLWAIINNAGICIYGEFDWLTPKQCSQQLDVNLYGAIRVTKAFLHLIRQSKGRVINITSINGQFAYPGLSIYCATKFGLEAFSDVLRMELAKYGVRIITIRPGDFARLTRIMANQETHMKVMWNCMNEEDKNFYDGYFQKFCDKTLKNIGMTGAKTFEKTSLFKDVEDALFSTNPSPDYTVAIFPFKMVYFLIRHLPTRWMDTFILYIVKKIVESE